MSASRKTVGRRDRGSATAPEPTQAALRRSGGIRLIIAVLVAGALTAALVAGQWGTLQIKTGVVGYPIFADFNSLNYSHSYLLVVVLFPIAAVLIFHGLTWLGARVGWATPLPRGPIRPAVKCGDFSEPPEPESSATINRRIGAGARVAFVGVVLGLEFGIAYDRLWLSVVLATVGYCLVVATCAAVMRRLNLGGAVQERRLAGVNALGASLTLGGLVLVSAHTEVHVLSTHTVHRYPWFPLWLGVVLTVVMFGWILGALRRAGTTASATIERRATRFLAAPVALFLLMAHLPGDLGRLGLFEQGQKVTEAMLVGHGWLPWRDVFLTHGLLGDAAPAAAGWGLFGNSYWAATAGEALLFIPLSAVTTYVLLASLVGRSWPLVLVTGGIYVGSWFGSVEPRFAIWPIILLLLMALLRRFTPLRAVVLALVAVANGIVTPEMAPGPLIVLGVVFAYEWYWRSIGPPRRQAYQRSIWLGVTTVVAVGAFTLYMASRGALDDVVYVTYQLLPGHMLVGAIPPQTTQSGVPEAQFLFVVLAPLFAVLISSAYAAIYLRLRRPFVLADWPMGAAAIFVVAYYAKFLARMDLPHAYQVFTVAAPLMVYITFRAVIGLERLLRAWVPEQRRRRLPASSVAIAVLMVFVFCFWGPLRAEIAGAPGSYRPTSPTSVAFERVGYSSQVDGPAIRDLGRILAAYLGPHDRLLDLTDEPALFYYFLGRDPSLRWYSPNGIIDTPALQRNFLSELRQSPPKLIVFDDTDVKMYGLPTMDGIPVSVRLYLIYRWVLEHYRPLLTSHGRTVYALPGVRRILSTRLGLDQRPKTTNVQFRGQDCDWSFAPTFLSGPAMPPSGVRAVAVRTVSAYGPQVTLTGWAGDLKAGQPAREVLATSDGRIVGRVRPGIPRPDVPRAGFPTGFARSGFHFIIPARENATGALRVFAVGRDGSIAELPLPGARVQGQPVTIGRRTVTLSPRADAGFVDRVTVTGAPSSVIKPPAGSSWSDYRWLEVQAPHATGFFTGGFTLSDLPGIPSPSAAGHQISFATLPQSPRRYVIPVSSCEQWYGYGSHQLFLSQPLGERLGGVGLIR